MASQSYKLQSFQLANRSTASPIQRLELQMNYLPTATTIPRRGFANQGHRGYQPYLMAPTLSLDTRYFAGQGNRYGGAAGPSLFLGPINIWDQTRQQEEEQERKGRACFLDAVTYWQDIRFVGYIFSFLHFSHSHRCTRAQFIVFLATHKQELAAYLERPVAPVVKLPILSDIDPSILDWITMIRPRKPSQLIDPLIDLLSCHPYIIHDPAYCEMTFVDGLKMLIWMIKKGFRAVAQNIGWNEPFVRSAADCVEVFFSMTLHIYGLHRMPTPDECNKIFSPSFDGRNIS
ncbi:hypothetical protein BDZ91DRAFT_759697 [Kalaharituber pfeilii]|nr:hypothetical protein BDZ91DRAFT_759697 [Kalaharituber pfeilii]